MHPVRGHTSACYVLILELQTRQEQHSFVDYGFMLVCVFFLGTETSKAIHPPRKNSNTAEKSKVKFKMFLLGTSLVVQWLRIYGEQCGDSLKNCK